VSDRITYSNIINSLVEGSPILRPLLNEHLRDQQGEVLQHVFFGDLTRFILSRIDGSKAHSGIPEDVAGILGFLEKALSSPDEKVKELIQVSFLENLEPSDGRYDVLKPFLGPKLRAELERLAHIMWGIPKS